MIRFFINNTVHLLFCTFLCITSATAIDWDIRLEAEKAIKTREWASKDLSLEAIQLLEKSDIKRAISHYEYHSRNKQSSLSDSAFSALLRLREHPESYFGISQSYLSRGDVGECLKWVEKHVKEAALLGHRDSEVLYFLQATSLFFGFPPVLQLQADYLEHLHVVNTNRPTIRAFSTHVKYYNRLKQMQNELENQSKAMNLVCKYAVNVGMPVDEAFPTYSLLKKTNGQSAPVAIKIFDVSRTLSKIAEDNLEKNPQLLFQFAQVLETHTQQPNDLDSVIDMYRRAAEHGCSDAASKLAWSPHFYSLLENIIGVQEMTNLFVRYKQEQGLLNLYTNMRNPVFLVILSLMRESKKAEIRQDINDLLAKHTDDSPLMMDFAIYQLLNSKDQEKQEKIKEIEERKIAVLNALSSKEQFEIAQEYKLVNDAKYTMLKNNYSLWSIEKFSKDMTQSSEKRAIAAQRLKETLDRTMNNFHENFKLFQVGYPLALERSADKGFLPAVEELLSLYSPQGALPSPEKAAFYGQMKDILLNEELALLEKAAKLNVLMAANNK